MPHCGFILFSPLLPMLIVVIEMSFQVFTQLLTGLFITGKFLELLIYFMYQFYHVHGLLFVLILEIIRIMTSIC